MRDDWVDFKLIKRAVNIQMVLDHYSIQGLTKHGEELRGPCPIHKGSGKKQTFTASVRKNAFKCFSETCGMRGNILDFVAGMEQCSVRDAAVKLQAWFKVGESASADQHKEERTRGKSSAAYTAMRKEICSRW